VLYTITDSGMEVPVTCTFVKGVTMTRRGKFAALFLVGVAMVAMFLLSTGVSGLDLSVSPGPFPFRIKIPRIQRGEMPPLPEEVWTVPLGGLSLLTLVLLPVLLVYLLVSPEARRRTLRAIGLALTFFLIFQQLHRRLGGFFRPALLELEGISEWGGGVSLTPPEEFLASPPRWLVWGISVVLALVVAAFLGGIAWVIWRRTHRGENLLEELAQEAQGAIASLQAGDELRNAVLRCYAGMIRVLSKQRGIERQKAMTPREFENHLWKTGLPHEAVHQLTRLFEEVRYGAKAPGQVQEQQAMACLQAIVEACGGTP